MEDNFVKIKKKPEKFDVFSVHNMGLNANNLVYCGMLTSFETKYIFFNLKSSNQLTLVLSEHEFLQAQAEEKLIYFKRIETTDFV